ncbi:MAG: NitT/TauT family transport system ATP-binding protein [Methanolobus sp.]|nr:NitT/TauT family transport system ATP-binding protein [Methanolobus sp.]MDK2911670.1 NitT/TauT family transport system ATP-binding protein [Methanolobus sp.]
MRSMHDAKLLADSISKSYSRPGEKNFLKVLDDIRFHIRESEFVSILGPSGCGKSTLLNILAGFETADCGDVACCGEPVKGPSPERAVVFQSPVLFPWLDVKDNILYGLKLKKEDRKESEDLASVYIKAVALDGFEEYFPSQLSGGMQQRAALARALVLRPKVLLMDEPFASLDAQTRYSMQQLLLSLHGKYRHTMVFITHDVEEALLMSDRICIMSKRPGRIVEEIDVPFERPRSLSLTSTQEFSILKTKIIASLMG